MKVSFWHKFQVAWGGAEEKLLYLLFLLNGMDMEESFSMGETQIWFCGKKKQTFPQNYFIFVLLNIFQEQRSQKFHSLSPKIFCLFENLSAEWRAVKGK